MSSRTRLTDAELDHALGRLPSWRREDDALARTFRFADFAEAMAFVNRVADLAGAEDHHPDITIRWNRVTLTLSTHSAGGITGRDLDLAAKIDGLP